MRRRQSEHEAIPATEQKGKGGQDRAAKAEALKKARKQGGER
jgi:hypothetical protein